MTDPSAGTRETIRGLPEWHNILRMPCQLADPSAPPMAAIEANGRHQDSVVSDLTTKLRQHADMNRRVAEREGQTVVAVFKELPYVQWVRGQWTVRAEVEFRRVSGSNGLASVD